MLHKYHSIQVENNKGCKEDTKGVKTEKITYKCGKMVKNINMTVTVMGSRINNATPWLCDIRQVILPARGSVSKS